MEFYEKGCQEKKLLLTWSSRNFPESQPRELDCATREAIGSGRAHRRKALTTAHLCLALLVLAPENGNQGSICDSRPIAMSGCPRGTTVLQVTFEPNSTVETLPRL